MKEMHERGIDGATADKRQIPLFSTEYLARCAEILRLINTQVICGYESGVRTAPNTSAVLSLITQDIGLTRVNQEDAAIVQHSQAVLLGRPRSLLIATLADGCGGAEGGEVASAIACSRIQQVALAGMLRALLSQNPEFSVFSTAAIQDTAFGAANRSILGQANEDSSLAGMASTGVSCIVMESYAHIAWAGDSRLYAYRDSSITQVTSDHNRAQILVEEGVIGPEDACRHPARSHLTNAIGTHDEDEGIPDCTIWHLHAGDLLILSSDGFHEGLTNEEMTAACVHFLQPPVTYESLRALARTLETSSLGRYGDDNLTAIFLYFNHLPNAKQGK